ncbi:hypothetical protein QFW77_13435, partial [Luteimonas sp. RD2P54]
PPPPTRTNLQAADAATADRSVAQMTPEQATQLQGEVDAMPQAERTDLLNDLASKLQAPQLVRLNDIFGADAVREAVETRSSAVAREGYLETTGAAPDRPEAPEGSGDSSAEQVERAQADYEARVEGQGILSQGQLGELMIEHQGDPAYLAELVKLAQEDGTLDAVVNPMYGGLYEKEGDSYVRSGDYDDRGDALRTAFDTAIAAAIDRGTLTGAQLRELGVHSSGWQDVAARAGVGQVGATDATRTTSTELDGLVDGYDDAVEDTERLDQELGGLLAQAGPLTPEQQAAFVEAFRNDPEHKPTYDAKIEATQALADYVAENRDAVLDAAVRDPEVAQQVHDAIVAMATDGHGVQALELLAEIQRVPDSALGEAFAGFTDLSGDVLTDAASSAMSELLARNDGSVTAAQAQFTTLMNSFAQGIPAWGGYKDFSDGNKLLNEFADGNYRAIDLYSRQYDESKPLFRAFAAAGVVLGAVSAAEAGRNEDYVNAISGFAQGGENAARLVAGATTSLSDTGRLAQHAGDFGRFATRLAPGLGLIASSTSLVNSIEQASDGNVGYAIAVAGDVLGVLGSAMELIPVTAPAGFIVSGIGALVNGIGSFIGEIINGNERREDLERYLTEAGVDPQIVGELASTGKALFEMSDALGMSPEQLQSLIAAHPEIASSPGHVGVFQDTAAAAGLQGAEVEALADRMAQDDPNFAWELFGVAGTYTNPSAEGKAAFLRDQLEIRFPGAAEYAEAQSPELFGAAAEQRERAVADYEREGFTMNWEMSLGNRLADNTDPAYRAEMIGKLQEDGRLEMWAQFLGGYGDNWADAARQSLTDAVAAGTVTQSEADAALAHFG